MKVLANDGVSKAGIKKLEKATSVVIFSSENKFDEYKFLIIK
jgi:hypothetical protein